MLLLACLVAFLGVGSAHMSLTWMLTRDLFALSDMARDSRAGFAVWRAASDAVSRFADIPTPRRYTAARRAIRHARTWLELDAAERTSIR